MEPSLNSSSLGLVQIDGLSDAGFSMNDFTARSLASLSSVVLFEEDQIPDEQREPTTESAGDPPAAIPSFLLRPDAVSPETIRSLCLSDLSPVQSDDAPSPAGQSDDASQPAGQSRPAPARTDQSHLTTNRANDISRDVARPGGQSQFGSYSAEVSRPSFAPISSEYVQRDVASYTPLDMQCSVVDFSGYQISARSTSIGAPSHVSRVNTLEPKEAHVSPVNPFETAESHISQADPFEFAVPSAPCASSLEVGGGNFQELQSEFDAGMFAKSEDALEAELKADEALLQRDVENSTDGAHSFCEKSSSTSFQRLSDNDLSLVKIRYFEGFSQPMGALGDVSGVERPPFGLSHVSVAPDDSDSGSTLHGSMHSVAVTSPQRSPDVNSSRTPQDPSKTFTLDSPGCPDHQSVAGCSNLTGAAGTHRSTLADPGRQRDSCRTPSVTTAGFSAGLVQLSPSGRLLAPGEVAAASSIRSVAEPLTEKVSTSVAAPQPVKVCTYSPPERGSKMLREMSAMPAVGVEVPLTNTDRDVINCSAVNAVLSTIRQQLALEELSLSESVNVTQMLADMQEEETRKLQLKLSATDRNGSRTSLKSIGLASDNEALPKQQLGSDVVCVDTAAGDRADTAASGRVTAGTGDCAATAVVSGAATAADGCAVTVTDVRTVIAVSNCAVTAVGGRATTGVSGRAAAASNIRAHTAVGGRAALASKQNGRPDPAPQQQPAKLERGRSATRHHACFSSAGRSDHTARHLSKPRSVSRDVRPFKTAPAAATASHRPRLKPAASLPLKKPTASSSAVASGAALRRIVPRMGARGAAAVETAVSKVSTTESGSYVSPEFLVSQVSRRYPSSTPKLAVSTTAVSLSADDSLHQISPIVDGGDGNPTHAAAAAGSGAARSSTTDDEVTVTPAETAFQQLQTDGLRQRPRRSRIPTPVWRKHAAESSASSAAADEAAGKQLAQRLIQTRESISSMQSSADSKVLAYKRGQRSSSIVRVKTSAPTRSGSSMSNSKTSDQLPVVAFVAGLQELPVKVSMFDERPVAVEVEGKGLPAGNCTIVLSDSSSSSASSERSAPGGAQLVQDASLTCDSSSTSSSLDSSAVTVTRSPRKAAASLASLCDTQPINRSARISSDEKECILLEAPREITLDEIICLGTEVVLPVRLTNISTGSIEVFASIYQVELDSVRLSDVSTALQAVSPSRSIVLSSQSATVKVRVVPIVAGCLSLTVALSASEVAPGSHARRHDLTVTVNCTVETPNLIFMSEEDNWLNFGSVPEECYKLLPLTLVNLGRCTVPVEISVTSPGDVFHLPDNCSVTGTKTQSQCQPCPGRLAPTRARFTLPPSDPHRPHVASVTWHVALRTPRLPTREGDRAVPLLESLQGTLDVSLSRAATADRNSNPHSTLLTCRLTATLGRVHLRMRCREPLELSCRPGHTTSAKLPMRNAGSVVLELSVSVRGPLRDHLLLHSPVLTIPPGSDRDLVVTYQPPRHPQQLLLPPAAATSSQLVMQVLPGGQLFEFAVTGVTTEASPGSTAARSSANAAHQTCLARAGSDVCLPAAADAHSTVSDFLQPVTVSRQRSAAPHCQQFTAASVPDLMLSGEPPVPVQHPEDLHIAMPPLATCPTFSVAASNPGRKPLSQLQPPQAATSVGCDMSEVQLRSSRSQLVWLGVPCELASRRSLLLRNSSQADLRLRLTIRDSVLFTFDALSSGSSGCFLDLVIPGRGDREVSVLFRPTEVTAACGLLVIKPRGQIASHTAVSAAAKLIKFSIPLIGYSGSCRVVCGPDSSANPAVDLGDVQADSTAQTSVQLSNTGNRPAFICSALFWDEECVRAVPAHQCIVSAERLVLPPGQSAQLQVALRVPATRDGGAISGGGANSTSSARSLLACLRLNAGDELMRQTYKRVSADKSVGGGGGDLARSSSQPRLLRDLRAQFVGEVADGSDHVSCLAGLKHLPDTLLLAVRQLKIPITASSSSVHGAEMLTLLPAEETCVSVLDFTAAAPSMVPSPAAQWQPPPSPPVRDH